MHDYVDQNVVGKNLDLHKVCGGLYGLLDDLNCSDIWFALNVQQLSLVKIPTHQFKKIVISYHTEYFDVHDLHDFFQANLDCEFLFLHDGIPETLWPVNVTSVQWISWGQQLDVAIGTYGIADAVMPVTKLVSSLSNRHEFHKAAVTAFLQKHFCPDQLILSWHDNRQRDLYYLDPDFFMPESIQNLVLDPVFQNQLPIKFDNNFNQSQVEKIIKWREDSRV